MPGTSVVQIGQRGAQTSLVHPRRRFRRQHDPDRRREHRRPGRPFRFRHPFHHGRRERGSLSRPELEPLRRRCGQRRGQPDHSARHHQLSIASSFHGDGGNFNTSHEEAGAGRRAQQARLPGRVQLAANLESSPNDEYHNATTCGESRLAAQRRDAIPRHGALRRCRHRRPQRVGLLSRRRSWPRRRTRTFTSAPPSTTRPRADFHNTVRYGADAQARAVLPVAAAGQRRLRCHYGDSASGNPVTITGANGYSATGQAVLDYAQTYPYQLPACLQPRSAHLPGRLPVYAAPGGAHRLPV